MRAQETFMSGTMMYVGMILLAIVVIVFLLVMVQRMFGVSL